MKCKRCNSRIKVYAYQTKEYGIANGMRFMQISSGGQLSMRPIPLCKDCIKKIEKWLYESEVEENE